MTKQAGPAPQDNDEQAFRLDHEIARKYDPGMLSKLIMRDAGRGESLDLHTRSAMERRLGGNFGGVRVYRGSWFEKAGRATSRRCKVAHFSRTNSPTSVSSSAACTFTVPVIRRRRWSEKRTASRMPTRWSSATRRTSTRKRNTAKISKRTCRK